MFNVINFHNPFYKARPSDAGKTFFRITESNPPGTGSAGVQWPRWSW
jgi:hypothetical protein